MKYYYYFNQRGESLGVYTPEQAEKLQRESRLNANNPDEVVYYIRGAEYK